jgi:hypothetical protein
MIIFFIKAVNHTQVKKNVYALCFTVVVIPFAGNQIIMIVVSCVVIRSISRKWENNVNMSPFSMLALRECHSYNKCSIVRESMTSCRSLLIDFCF